MVLGGKGASYNARRLPGTDWRLVPVDENRVGFRPTKCLQDTEKNLFYVKCDGLVPTESVSQPEKPLNRPRQASDIPVMSSSASRNFDHFVYVVFYLFRFYTPFYIRMSDKTSVKSLRRAAPEPPPISRTKAAHALPIRLSPLRWAYNMYIHDMK